MAWAALADSRGDFRRADRLARQRLLASCRAVQNDAAGAARLAAGLPARFRGEGGPAAAGGAAPSVPGPMSGLETLVEDAYTLRTLSLVTRTRARPGNGCKCDDPTSRRVPGAAG